MTKYEGFVGKVLDGRYKILELVGLGGMACVLKAQDLVMNRIVAIKILNDEYNGNESAEARFIDESKAVAMLSNKNIVSVYDVAIYPDIKYIVMEYLDGITLREYLDNKGAIGWKEACIYILQILRALEHAHSKGIIHRDIKPQNVILMKNGDIKVTDFGIAKLPNTVAEQKDEKAIGTVYYISPEQACGKETDYYSDIYSVGIMLYEAVTGTLPFTAETPMEVAMMQVNDEPVHPRDIVLDIPVAVSQIILKAMEKSPSDRFQSAHTMVKAIEWVLRYPDVIFSMNSSSADEGSIGNSSVVSIEMISTAEIEPYESNDIMDAIDGGYIDKSGPKKTPETKKKKTAKKKRKINKSMFPIICGVSGAFILVAVVLLITIGMNAYSSLFQPEEVPESEYPNIVDMIYTDELKDNLRNGLYGAKFVIDEVVYDNREDVENGKIVSTDPPAGHVSKPDSDGKLHFTRVTVNRSEKVLVPLLEGYPKTRAQTLLEGLKLKYDFVETEPNDTPYTNDGQIIKTEPSYGTEVKVGDTITVYICKQDYPDKTDKLPNLVGMTEANAIKFAEVYCLYSVTVEYEETPDGDGRVIKQSIKEGTVSDRGTELVITVAKPMKELEMPDLIGLSLDEAKELFEKEVANPDIVLHAIYLKADASDRKKIERALEDVMSFSDCISALLENGCVQVFDEPEGGAVVYQDVFPEDVIPDNFKSIDLIVLAYSETTDVSTDESNDNTSVDNSTNDEQSNAEESKTEDTSGNEDTDVGGETNPEGTEETH